MGLIENLLPDRFEIIGELGRGGSSIVYHARDKDRDQEVAVKVLLKDSEEDRFKREAERLESINHPNVVRFLEVDRHDGRDFLVMEYLEMGDLTSYVQKLSVMQILQIFSQVCDGLAHLHDKGIVHRDIKPANILVSREGRPKITDLGVARQMERNTRLTQAGTILGTYSYLAPEQILSSSVGPRADIYSLGICLFACLTGRKPFEADNEFQMLKAHLEAEPPKVKDFLPDAPDVLEELVQSMLSKDEDDRPRSARAVADMLQDAVRELESGDQEDMQPAWDERIEELPEDQRSVLLAISFLGDEATFERVCCATPYAEDRTDRCLEALIEGSLVDSPCGERFSLRVPGETMETRLTPRLRKLFANRLAALTDSTVSGELPAVESSEPEISLEDEPTVIGQRSLLVDEDSDTVIETPETEVVEPDPELELLKEPEPEPEPESEPEPEPEKAEAPQPEVVPPKEVEPPTPEVEKPKPPAVKPSEKQEKKPRWGLISLCMMLLGVLLAAGGNWYYAHSVTVNISTHPSGATVKVNGHEEGVTPITVSRLRPGLQAIDVTLEGHSGVEERIELGFQENRDLHYTLDPSVGKLFLTLNPRDAVVTIDEQVYGMINSDITLPAGKHKLLVKKDGYEDYESSLKIDQTEPLEVDVVMTPIVASVTISSDPKGAEVSFDGEKKGKTPVTIEKVSFGSHDVAVRMKGHDRINDSIEVKSKETVKFHAKLKELPGGLVVTSEPKGAKIKVNGEVKGETPMNLTGLKAGSYTVMVSKDGYKVAQEKKTVVAGEERKVNFKLQSNAPPPPVNRPVPPPPTYRPPPSNRPPPPPTYRPPPPPPSSNPWIIE